jgi:fumarylacetoacetate (FAA) hydrolase family protein
MINCLPNDHDKATLVARVWRPDVGPSICAVRQGELLDVTCREVPTLRDLLELDDPVDWLQGAKGDIVTSIAGLDVSEPAEQGLRLLAPCDLQAIKACGVTFAKSMIERVIEERASGDPTKAEAIRATCTQIIGDRLSNLIPGSEQAEKVKSALIEEGLWSQYLEVGIGPDAEVFTKASPMSAVGHGASVGLHPKSTWNNPEPEIVLAVNSRGEIKGATLGNDVNLRDFEGRSALLLGKAKDNNASTAIGPFLRLFDDNYTMDHVASAELTLTVQGPDTYVLNGHSSMAEISRTPVDLVNQTIGKNHQYPDGVMLYMGTLFAPTEDRDAPGMGFTHKIGDVVTIAEPFLGSLQNTVRLTTQCPPWNFGTAALMRNLAGRGLI